MNRIRRTTTTVIAFTLSLVGLAVTGPAAFAQVPAPEPAGTSTGELVVVTTSGGSHGLGVLPGWGVALAAIGIALVAACMTLLAQRIAAGQRSSASVANA